MFFETIPSPGLAHLSYMLGDGGEAVVIDPRRDYQMYVEIARQQGARITHIFETHRNEDYLIGSRPLAQATGATIYHGGAIPFTYGTVISDGEEFGIGGITCTARATPGHTPEHMALLVAEGRNADPFAVFTGDALFVNSVGRTDLLPGREEELANLLYDTLFSALLVLPDGTLIHPAHGKGSFCGTDMSSREVSTIGYERRYNPFLQYTARGDFVRAKLAERLEKPPYFARMEEENLRGALLDALPDPGRLSPDELHRHMDAGMLVVDVRRPEAFGGAHVPGAWSITRELLGHFAGWFLPADRPIGLVVEDEAQRDAAVRDLIRIGCDRIVGYLPTMADWSTSGRPFATVPQVSMQEVLRRRRQGARFTLLDVRSPGEFAAGHLPGARHIFVGHLPDHLDDVPRDMPVVTLCSTGRRASIAASLLRQHGFAQVENCLGSMKACDNLDCPVERAA